MICETPLDKPLYIGDISVIALLAVYLALVISDIGVCQYSCRISLVSYYDSQFIFKFPKFTQATALRLVAW